MKSIDLDDFSDYLGDFTKRSLKAKREAVVKGILKSIPDLIEASPVDTGLYASSWEAKATESGVSIGNTAPYASIIEYGARPFTPPIGPLLAWAKRVLGEGGGHDTGQPETDYTPEVWRLAKGVQKKIAEHGMAPHHILENMTPKILENIRNELKQVRG